MISSMTKQERKDPDLIAKSPSRKQRIANGSGHKLQDVTKLVADFQTSWAWRISLMIVIFASETLIELFNYFRHPPPT